MEEVIIVGAGVAGLSCMNALLDAGIKPLLIDAGLIGTEKICGEFLSQIACQQLARWGVHSTQEIDAIDIFTAKSTLHLTQKAGALSRSEAEILFARRAKSLGGTILENTKISKTAAGLVTLQDGTCIQTKHLVIATGRLGTAPKHFPYMGLKAHFTHERFNPRLEMHLFKGGYYGIVPINKTMSNIACLVKENAYSQGFSDINTKFADKNLAWLTSPVGAFGMKKVANLPTTYYIGDAIASLPPAIGGGFGHAVFSSLLASQNIVQGSPDAYLKELKASLLPKLRAAHLLNHIMMNPSYANFAISLLKYTPRIQTSLLKHVGL
jgi:flavin-dependent dehydrogenase